MEQLQPPVPESKYAPLSYSEFLELKEHLKGIKNHLPEHLMNPFWNWCNIIRGERISQPCSCASSARHWGACVTTLNEFVKSKDGE